MTRSASSAFTPLSPARWSLDAQGTLRSRDFDDVFFPVQGALRQARQVFLAGNRLPERWRGRSAFTICETGFGPGFNFLASWHAWQQDPRRSGRLHYLAFEASPWTPADLRQVWQPVLSEAMWPLAEALLAQWPPLLPGMHQLAWADGAVTLTLVWGDIARLARQVRATVDAFYLDGFSPRVNPDIWSPAVFGQLRRLAREDAHAASWCVAGQVRRDLRNAGFLVSKAPGFGGKRETMTARLRPGLGRGPARDLDDAVAVVGGGLAGAAVAYALARRGLRVTVLDAGQPWVDPGPVGLSGALVPALTVDDDTRSRLSRAGLARAWARWSGLPDPARPRPCGALVCAEDAAAARAQQQALRRLQFPADWVRWVEPQEAARRTGIAGIGAGLWFSRALRVSVGALVAVLLRADNIVCRSARVARLSRAGSGPAAGWHLLDDEGRILNRSGQVILANALGVPPLLASVVSLADWPVLAGLKPIAGQLSLYPVEAASTPLPRSIVCGDGYCLPPDRGWGVVGSTYRPWAAHCRPDSSGHAEIRARLGAWLPESALPWLGAHPPSGWGGWRAATRDHLPVIGPVPGQEGLWVASAYGSRGLSWAALAGDILAASLYGEPVPLERELLRRIAVR